MSTYVLIHGTWHGGWCWERVVGHLEEAGHGALAPDLPGHGADGTPAAQVTLDAYVRRACDIIDAEPEPVVLVGHSMGGIVITQTAEERPDRIAAVVYLTAYLLPNGAALTDYADADPDRPLTRNVVVAPDGQSTTVRPEAPKEIFYNDCADDDVAWAAARLVPQPAAPRQTPVRTTDGNFGRVPRVYIECTRDNAMPLERQRRLHARLPCERVIAMDASHSPFLSQPEELARHLMSIS